MIVAGNTGLIRGFSYIVGQLAGAVLAILTLDQYVWGLDGLGVQSLGVGVATVDGFVLEVILTFFLVFTVFATTVDKRGSAAWAPLAIGMVIFVDHLIAVQVTGASMNPARSFGPALIHGAWDVHWLYWAGPIVGGLLAAIAYVVIFGTKEDQYKLGTINIRSD
jgi:glycerol uptake facilitator-like aquaporin